MEKKLLEIVKIKKKEYSLLRNKSLHVSDPSHFKEVAINMVYTLNRVNGFGLAAPQIGLMFRFFVAKIDRVPTFMFNPQILKVSQRKVKSCEGCLSIPFEQVNVERYENVLLEYEDFKGNKKTVFLTGLNAIIVQHEIDHLDGILIDSIEIKEEDAE